MSDLPVTPRAVALAIAVVFVILALVHAYWAMGGEVGKRSVVPERAGRPAFTPSTSGTVLVAVALATCAALVVAAGGVAGAPVRATWLRVMLYLLAGGLALRAVGDFNLLGFTKRVRGSRFARLDTTIFAPLCLVLACGVLYVASAAPP